MFFAAFLHSVGNALPEVASKVMQFTVHSTKAVNIRQIDARFGVRLATGSATAMLDYKCLVYLSVAQFFSVDAST